jgi:hypothetical protein
MMHFFYILTEDETPTKSTVLGRPVLLALEDVDGAPSFLEKALRFVENHGVRIEGILRQAADVDDVEHRIREYEKGLSSYVYVFIILFLISWFVQSIYT